MNNSPPKFGQSSCKICNGGEHDLGEEPAVPTPILLFLCGNGNSVVPTPNPLFLFGPGNATMGTPNHHFLSGNSNAMMATPNSLLLFGNGNAAVATLNPHFLSGNRNATVATPNPHLLFGNKNSAVATPNPFFSFGNRNTMVATPNPHFLSGNGNTVMATPNPQFLSGNGNTTLLLLDFSCQHSTGHAVLGAKAGSSQPSPCLKCQKISFCYCCCQGGKQETRPETNRHHPQLPVWIFQPPELLFPTSWIPFFPVPELPLSLLPNSSFQPPGLPSPPAERVELCWDFPGMPGLCSAQ